MGDAKCDLVHPGLLLQDPKDGPPSVFERGT